MSEKRLLGLLLILSFIFFFYRLGSFPLIGPDEPRYAQVAREMLQRRDLITPTIGGHLWAEKPALLYWLMMLAMSLLDATELAARLPSALLATLAVLAVSYTGRRLISPRFGFLSGLVLIVNAMFASFAHGASTDMPLSAMLALGLCGFMLFDAQPDRGTGWMLAACGGFALAVLAKGLVGLILPAGIIGAYLLLSGRLGTVREMRLAVGAALFLALAATWYAPVIVKHGWAFIDEFFISHHFQRYTTNRFHHPGPVYYFVLVILGGVFPWTAFLVSALGRLRWSERQSDAPRDRLRWFCAVWMLVPLLFFSFSSSKLPGYLLPALPAAAFLAAMELERLLDVGADRALKWALSFTPLLIIAVGAAGVIFARRQIQSGEAENALILLMAAATGAAFFSLCLVRKFRAAVATLVTGCALGFIFISHAYLPAVADRESRRALAELALGQMRPGERIVGYHYFHHSLTFYTNARSFYDEKGNVIIAASTEELIERARQAGSVLCVVREHALADLMKDARLRIESIGRQRDTRLIRVRLADTSSENE